MANPVEAAEPKMTRQARWQGQHPKAAWAWAALRSAMKRGLVERQPCEVCGKVEVDGHHTDYDRPLMVTWLCRRHHRAEHRRVKHGE